MDILGHMFSLVLDGKFFLAPIDEHPQRILDLGCGTGLWAIEMGDLYPSGQVTSLHLHLFTHFPLMQI